MALERTAEQLDLLAASSPATEAGSPVDDPVSSDRAAHRVGAAHERELELAGERKRSGAYYTPPEIVEGLLDLCLDPILEERGLRGPEAVKALRVLDPACGSGNFLVAVGARIARRLESLGMSRRDAAAIGYGECVVGVDIDPVATELCTSSLVHAGRGTVTEVQARSRVYCMDALATAGDGTELLGSASWQEVLEAVGAPGGFDLVVGNPPFLSQLAVETVRREECGARLRRRFGGTVTGLTDTAVLFLLLAVELAKERHGTACLVQPISMLSTRDAAGARKALLGNCGLRAMWLCEDEVFAASVRVCAPVLVRGAQHPAVTLVRDRDFASAGAAVAGSLRGATWSALLAATSGVPDRELRTSGVVGDIASATADFRDQYYGLRGCVLDARDGDDALTPPLVTAGLIDPAVIHWGTRSTRFDKAAYGCPRVDLAKLEPRLRRWADDRLRPKVLLATQTKVLEAAVDLEGRFLPSVPVVTITPDDIDDLWLLGALLISPPITLVAAWRHLGAALSSEALKLSASDVLELPLPADRRAWRHAAEHFMQASGSPDEPGRRAALTRSAEAMCEAFGLHGDTELMSWWSSRLPRQRAGSDRQT